MSEFQMVNSREFQAIGAVMQKALLPKVRYLVLMMGMRLVSERGYYVGEV